MGEARGSGEGSVSLEEADQEATALQRMVSEFIGRLQRDEAESRQ
jgi:hypothetical protein